MIWIALSFLSGSIPFGLLIARARTGTDVRTRGSGNIGATNVARVAGRGAAVATLVLDAAKGFAPVCFAVLLAQDLRIAAGCALAAVLGHCFTPWLGFRGGKGVATGLGVTLALAPLAALGGALTWLAVWKLLRISSVGSLCGVAVAVALAALFRPGPPFWGLVCVALVILARHHENLRRLLANQEQ